MESYHVGVAAEAFAAGLFAQAGCSVFVQYGANQPGYDLVVTKEERTIKVSVKGSQDGGWGLIQNYKKKGVSYHETADLWAERHKFLIVYCLVQFERVMLGECPRVYLATVQEITAWHKASRNGLGSTILCENYTYIKGAAAGITDQIPSAWRFSELRLHEMLLLADS